MLDIFGDEPTFAAPPIQIFVGPTYVKFRASKNGVIGNGISLAPFMKQFLEEREWVPRFKTYITTYRYSSYDPKSGMATIPRYALASLLQYLEGTNVEIVNVEPITPRKIKIQMKRKFQLRPNQIPLVEFMTQPIPFKPLSAYTGIGKTVVSIVASVKIGYVTLIVLSGLISQWYKEIRQYTNLASHDIYVIQGYEVLKKLWEAAKKGYRPKFIIFSTRTLLLYIDQKGQYADLPTYAKFQEIFGIGTKLIDETHMGFHANTQVDLASNIANNIYLSATYQRNQYQSRRIFDMVFPKEMRFGEALSKKYTTVQMVKYHLGIPQADTIRFKTKKGYNHALYENYLQHKPIYLNNFISQVILPLISMYYLNVKKTGQRLLILTATKNMTLALANAIQKNVPGLKSSVYFSGDSKHGKETNLLSDIIISTHQSCGTGRDIKLLKTCINTVSFASEPLTTQVMGRLRELPGEETIHVDMWNGEIASHYNHYRDRMEVYKVKALKYFENLIC